MTTNVYKTALSCYLVTWPISNSEARFDCFNTTFRLFVLFLCLQAFHSYHLHMESSKICNQSQFHLRFHSKARALKTHFQIEKSITLRNMFLISFRFGVKCGSVNSEQSLLAPCYSTSTQACTLQSHALLFSCVKKAPDLRRLCPCRDFQAQQVALCTQCH